MARISFTAIVSEIVGKLAGSVFQYSYGGFQIHTRVSPRNPQTKYSQLRRGDFGFLSQSFRNLTIPQRETWTDNAPAGQSALNFFIESNVNLILIARPTITTWLSSTATDDFPMEFDEVSGVANAGLCPPKCGNVFIKRKPGPPTVPTGKKLLVFLIPGKSPSQAYINPSEYSPVVTFDEGTDMSIPVDIIAEYKQRFGPIIQDKLYSLKSVLIDKTNGTRGEASYNQTISTPMAKFVKLTSLTADLVSVGTGSNDIINYNLLAGELPTNGDCLECYAFGNCNAGAAANVFRFILNGSPNTNSNIGAAAQWSYRISLIRQSNTTARITTLLVADTTVIVNRTDDLTGLDFSSNQTLQITMQAILGAIITAKGATVNKEIL